MPCPYGLLGGVSDVAAMPRVPGSQLVQACPAAAQGQLFCRQLATTEQGQHGYPRAGSVRAFFLVVRAAAGTEAGAAEEAPRAFLTRVPVMEAAPGAGGGECSSSREGKGSYLSV